MIRKKRRKPVKLLKTGALLRRTPEEHPKRYDIEQDWLKLSAGFKGEQSLDYHLSFIDPEPFLILHDLRLHVKIHYFQIDTLILHPSFFLVIEVKNISGTLYFDPMFDQMVRTKNEGQQEVFPDPVRQVKRQSMQLATWLKNRKFEPPPIESVVVMANSHSLLQTSPDNQACLKKVIRDTRLVETIGDFAARHQDEFFTSSELRKIASLLIRSDTPLNPDVLSQYRVKLSDLVTGVFCPECKGSAMEKKSRTWHCPHCSHRSQDAHLKALRDYGLLVEPKIGNRSAREFLHLPSSKSAYSLLKSLGAHHNGTTKGRKYDLTKLLN